MKNNTLTKDILEKIEKESESQVRPDQKAIVTVSSKLRKRLHNLPDPTNPPLGWDDHKAFGAVYPYLKVPALHPKNHGDTVIFNHPDALANRLYLGDNLEVLRTLPAGSIDLIYIDPPFFSGRNYNVIWGDSNEVRTFEDIWEGGINSYLIWLNARLWEMRRVLKKTGSIYVHCDWHASHYIKTEMDKIFGYENFRNEIVWCYSQGGRPNDRFANKHDLILHYGKSQKTIFNEDLIKIPYELLSEKSSTSFTKIDKYGRKYKEVYGSDRKKKYRYYEDEGKVPYDWWADIHQMTGRTAASGHEYIGYPTQKPETLLERIINASSDEGDVVADFFCGGGTTLAVAQKLKRRFIGCDSSRVAISVTLDRSIKIGEEMSGVKSNISKSSISEDSLKRDLFDDEKFQLKLQTEGVVEKVPNIEVWYLGIYPVEKFQNLEQEEFIDFVLTAYGASKNTGGGITSGYRPPGQQEPILVGPPDPNKSIDAQDIKKFFDEIKARLEVNKLVRAKIIAWRFSRQVLAYIKTLRNYAEKHNLPLELEAIPLDSKEFRARILQRMPDIEENEFFLRFSKPPAIGDIKVKKVGPLEYEFEVLDAISTNEDGWLVNCQWDFNYQEGHFAANKDYVLSREKKKAKKHGEIFEAIFKARHKFEKDGEYVVACKIQDNLAGETILSKKIEISV